MRNLKTQITRKRLLVALAILVASVLLVLGISKIVSINTQLDAERNQNTVKAKQLKELESKIKSSTQELQTTREEKMKSDSKNLELEVKNKDLESKLLTKQENAKKIAQSYKAKAAVATASPGARTASTAGNTYVPGSCTWYVKNQRPDIGNRWGNANQWLASARAAGFTVTNTPAVGSVAVQANHVALVTAVGDGTVTISEMNYGGLYRMNTRTVAVSLFTYIS
jgi:surface antigen